METREVARKFIENLFINDDVAYALLDENVHVHWPGFGMEAIVGKENLRNFLQNGGPDKIIQQTVHNLIAEGDTVVGDGTMITERKGITETSHFADVYKIKNGKIISLTSYMVMENPENK